MFKKLVFFSDEVHFHLSGYVKKQNMRYWVEKNPPELYQMPLDSPLYTSECSGFSPLYRYGKIWFLMRNARCTLLLRMMTTKLIAKKILRYNLSFKTTSTCLGLIRASRRQIQKRKLQCRTLYYAWGCSYNAVAITD